MTQNSRLLVYGAYGYTGRLVAEAAADRGLDPVLGGRDGERLETVGESLGLPTRSFPVSEAKAFVGDVDVVLNCAGPFDETADPMVDACIERGTHYLDITGELSVFERIKRRSDEADAAGVTLLPGVGFDVVPTDCLAAHLSNRLPDATHLTLALDADGGVSGGTLKTVLSDLGEGGAVRQNGVLRRVPFAHRTRAIDFGDGLRRAVTIPWGDVSTAGHTTDVPDVEVYIALPWAARRVVAGARYVGGPVSSRPAQFLLRRVVDRYVDGPDERTRREGEARIWGEARSADDRVVSRLRTPETYALTVETALLTAQKTLAGEAPTGYQTPAAAFGADLILEVPGTERVDFEADEVVARATGPETGADSTAAVAADGEGTGDVSAAADEGSSDV
jgi:short subunit dehydrogenase-like uncharacterized protein